MGAEALAAYLAFDGEPDVRHVLDRFTGKGKTLALPLIGPAPEPAMEFHQWRPSEPLICNRYGIEEPSGGRGVPVGDLAAVLMPLVAFDEYGGRLGMGAGFYDRALSRHRNQARPLRIGVAYSLQQVTRVPTRDHDVELHAVVTEQGWFTCRG